MAVNSEVRRLAKKWNGGTGWPKRLEWLEIQGIRGWDSQRISFDFPIVAIVGENGSGKSTLLQAAASAYRAEAGGRTWFPSEFFPQTAWDTVTEASIRYGFQEGANHNVGSVRRPTTRWLGHGERPIRRVEYTDLNRIQPVGARVGYARIAKTRHEEASAKAFGAEQVKRLSGVLGRQYDSAKMALSSIDAAREVPVISRNGREYSGFHQGSGEITVTELLQTALPKYGLVLIDEIESSLHPRAQRRLIRDLAEQCREQEFQLIITTHSPYILEELPLEARMYILENNKVKTVVNGISPQFAMTKMDDEGHPECDLYVEDEAAKTMLGELLANHAKEIYLRCTIVPFGAASVGYALGQMVAHKRFPRPSCVFLDGDSAPGDGCVILPGGDAPERVVFETLKADNWAHLWTRIGRDMGAVEEACNGAMTLGDHHEWVRYAATQLRCGSAVLWQAMCAEWAPKLSEPEYREVVNAVVDALPS